MKELIKGLYCILPEFDTIKKYKRFVTKLLRFKPNIIQLRIKYKSDSFFYKVAYEIKKILSSKDIFFIIDDRVDIALLIKSHGVHLGQDDLSPLEVRNLVNNLGLKKFIIGYSTHSLEQAKIALNFCVDYISIGPIFKTNTKPDYIPVGIDTLKKVKEFIKNKIPIVAIGGINDENVDLVKKIGVDAIATISAIRDLNPKKIEKLKF